MRDGVRLREVTESDLPSLFEHQRDPDAVRMAAVSAREREAFSAHWKRILADPKVTARTIVYGEAVAGNIVTFDRLGKREVGYWLGREYWGRGIATAALRDFLATCSERPLYARVASHNRASLRVLSKCGFRVLDPAEESLPSLGDSVEEIALRLDAVGEGSATGGSRRPPA